MGVRINAQKRNYSEYVEALDHVLAGVTSRISKPWLWPEIFFLLSREGRHFHEKLKIMRKFTFEVGDFIVSIMHFGCDLDNRAYG